MPHGNGRWSEIDLRLGKLSDSFIPSRNVFLGEDHPAVPGYDVSLSSNGLEESLFCLHCATYVN